MDMQGMAKLTMQRRRATATRFAAFLGGEDSLLDAKSSDVAGWLASLKLPSGEPIAPQSRGMYLKDLRHLYRWLGLHERIQRDPTTVVPLPKVPNYQPRPVSTDDLRAAVEAADERVRTILVLAAFAGLRAHEIAQLHSVDANYDENVLHVRGKGERDRVVPMHPLVCEVLAKATDGPVVRSMNTGGSLTAKTITSIVSRHFRAVGCTATAHRLRHWFGTNTYAECLDLRAVQKLLGHANPTTTAIYVAYSQETQRSAVAALSLAG